MCDTMVKVDKGRVLFAKNSDRDPNEAQVLEWHPPAEHHSSPALRCTHIEIAQVPRTRGIAISRPFWGWGAEMGTNDAGVVIGNEAVFTTEPLEPAGLTGMDLVRLALERADSATAAAEVIVALIDAFGQGGRHGHEDPSHGYHNSFLVADAHRAVVVETAGRRWAIEEIDSGARAISNGLTIPGFAETYVRRGAERMSQSISRRIIAEAGASDAHAPADLMAVLRTHEGDRPGPTYHARNGAMAAPCMHAGGKDVASQTTSSWVSELTPRANRHWTTATAAPCTAVFKPIEVDRALDVGPEPKDRSDSTTIWWRHERLHRLTMTDPDRLLPRYAPERDELEDRFAGRDVDPEAAWREADDALDRWTVDVEAAVGADRRPRFVRKYWAARDRLANGAGTG